LENGAIHSGQSPGFDTIPRGRPRPFFRDHLPVPMLRRLGATTRLSLALLMLGWLLLQTLLTVLGRDPAMLEIGRVVTMALIVTIPASVWLLRTVFPEADFPPQKLEALLMIAAFGFATALVLRWVLQQRPRSGSGLATSAAG
jgi:hypothetical protein